MYETAKRFLDISTALAVLIIFSPIFIIIPALIKLDSSGPVFYKQRRVGKDGKEFFIYKFRNMYTNADEMVMQDPVFRKLFKKKAGWKLDLDEDPRITKIGKFLRKYSLDELPQIFNILEGTMSMVGPRAYRRDGVGDEIEEQLKNYPKLRKKMKLVLSVKPGLTGPWQTSGRNDLSWDRRVNLDADYAQRKSLLYDIFILLRTPGSMLSRW
mgnify:CR=1 FL=1